MAKKSNVGETPIQIRLLDLRKDFDGQVQRSGIGQNALIRLAVEELLAKYQTPEEVISAAIRSRTAKVLGA